MQSVSLEKNVFLGNDRVKKILLRMICWYYQKKRKLTVKARPFGDKPISLMVGNKVITRVIFRVCLFFNTSTEI